MCLLVEILAQCAYINISSHEAHLAESVVKAGLSVEQLEGVLLPLGLESMPPGPDSAEWCVGLRLRLLAEPAEQLGRRLAHLGPLSAGS